MSIVAGCLGLDLSKQRLALFPERVSLAFAHQHGPVPLGFAHCVVQLPAQGTHFQDS
jgi:hypothetical protein